jgi:hypothetical protein
MSTSIYGRLDGARLIKGCALARRLGSPEDGAAETHLDTEEQLRIAIEAIGQLQMRVETLAKELEEPREGLRNVRRAARNT